MADIDELAGTFEQVVAAIDHSSKRDVTLPYSVPAQ